MVIELKPQVLTWARERASLSREELAGRMGVTTEKVAVWERTGELTFRQTEKLAQATHTALGYLFLADPPIEGLPIPDLRTVGSVALDRPSPDLLEVIYQSQRRQDWFREYLIGEQEDPLNYVGCKKVGSDVVETAANIRSVISFHPSSSEQNSLDGVIREFSEAIEKAGILVVRTGTVGNNTHRVLNPHEFRGFALSDPYAPLIFINAADFKAAQLFTLAHELAHIWAGESALSNFENTLVDQRQGVETYCNAVAAEFLLPIKNLRLEIRNSIESPLKLVERLRKKFRVSELVIIRRLYDAGELSPEDFKKWYTDKIDDYKMIPKSSGGDFYKNQPNKVGRRFAGALIASAIEGKTLLRDAMALLDIKKISTFAEFARTQKFRM